MSIQVADAPSRISARTSDEESKRIYAAPTELAEMLRGVGVKANMRDVYTPGRKFIEWEHKVSNRISSIGFFSYGLFQGSSALFRHRLNAEVVDEKVVGFFPFGLKFCCS